MKKEEILQTHAMPAFSPSYPAGPYYFKQREYLIVTYESDPEIVRAALPEPLEPAGEHKNLCFFEWMKMPDSSGFGDYQESGNGIAALYNGQPCNFSVQMYLNDEPPITAGREIWGFPKKLASPRLSVDGKDTLLGTLDYGTQRIATGTMGYKFRALDLETERRKMADTPNYLLKVIPHVDGTARICELVRFFLKDVNVIGAWEGPAALELHPHALAPVADLPVKKIVGAKHVIANLTLDIGEVAFDYLDESTNLKLAVNQ